MPKNLKMYMGYDKAVGSAEGACLIFANNPKEARKLAYKVIRGWVEDCEWIDIVAKTITGHEYLDKECKSEEPHAIESPRSCDMCGLWGIGEIVDGLCPGCTKIEE